MLKLALYNKGEHGHDKQEELEQDSERPEESALVVSFVTGLGIVVSRRVPLALLHVDVI